MVSETFALDGKRQDRIKGMIKNYIDSCEEGDRIPVGQALYYLLGHNAEDKIVEMKDALHQLTAFICNPAINTLFMKFINGVYAEGAGKTLIEMSELLTNLNNSLALAQITFAEYDAFGVCKEYMDFDEEVYSELLQVSEFKKSLSKNRKTA